MLFNSIEFVAFLVAVWPVWRLLRTRRLPALLYLLLVSAFFYGCWKPWYLILIAASTLLQYGIGLRIAATEEPERRKLWLWAGVVGDLALLGTFKYGNFLIGSVESFGELVGSSWQLPRVPSELPVGISFYTFQTLSYIIDIYRREIKPARSLLDFAVYVFFFPQLVAGPIVRAADFLPQLRQLPSINKAAIGGGVFLILSGLFKKMALADTIRVELVEPFFGHPEHGAFPDVLIALWAANFQVYCDFSGYSDVAVGVAALFGYHLPPNFDRPFWSRSPMEHWRRWHLSLSSWLKDYLYIPLGGSRGGHTDRNLIITFLLGGLWHGAGWNFVIWGLYNGVVLALWRRFGPRADAGGVGGVLQAFVTFNTICLGLVFLHAKDFQASLETFSSFLRPSPPQLRSVWGWSALLVALGLHFTPVSWKQELRAGFGRLSAWTLAVWVVVVGALLSVFSGRAGEFFYFQF